MGRGPDSRSIEGVAQLRGLRSPLRQEIVDALQAEGPCSIAELAGRLERSPDSLYYHVRALLRLGLLTERNGLRAAPGLVVDVPVRPMRIRYRLGDRAQSRALGDIVGAMLRLTARDFRAGQASPRAVSEGPRRNLWASRCKARLAPARLAELTRLLGRVSQILTPKAGASPGADSELVALTFVLTPVEAGRRQRRGERRPRRKNTNHPSRMRSTRGGQR
jgi:DNA-binding transcriptional ArsR family regulator